MSAASSASGAAAARCLRARRPVQLLPVPQAGAAARRPGRCGRSPSTSPASASPIARRTSTTRGRGSSRWIGEAIDALGSTASTSSSTTSAGRSVRVGGAQPGRVLSLTVLNTMLDVATFRRPWSMAPFATRGVGEAWLRGRRSPASRPALLRPGDRRPIGDHARRGRRLLLPPAPRRRPRVPAHHARVRADRGEAAVPLGRPRQVAPIRPGSSGASSTRLSTSTSSRSRRAGAWDRRPDPPAREALPPGGPGARDRPRDRAISRRPAWLAGSASGAASTALDQPRARRAPGRGSRRGRSRAGPRRRAAPPGPRPARSGRRSGSRRGRARASRRAASRASSAASRAVECPVSAARPASSSAKLPSWTRSCGVVGGDPRHLARRPCRR